MFRTPEQLETDLAAAGPSPREQGTVELIVSRPALDERAVLETAMLDLAAGLVGDSWSARPSPRTPDHAPYLEAQVTLINARVMAVIAGERNRWPAAGDQLYVDLDLSTDNVPPGTRLQIGDAVLAVSELPHTGCAKFSARYGSNALRWINSPAGRARNLRGVHARVVTPGQIRRGDAIRKL